MIIQEGIYSNMLLDAFLRNVKYDVIKIVKQKNIISNMTLFNSIKYLIRRTSILFLIAKSLEVIIYRMHYIIPIQKRIFKSLNEISRNYGIHTEIADDINNHFSNDNMYKDDYLLSISYFQILKDSTISKFKAAFNIHPAPLPEGRGLFPSFWLLLYPTINGRYYQTVHLMTNRIDGGEIVVQSSVQAQKAHCSSSNYMLCCTKLGCELLESINFTGEDTNFTFPGKESYFSFPRSIDVIRFWKNGNRFFRWRDISKIFLM